MVEMRQKLATRVAGKTFHTAKVGRFRTGWTLFNTRDLPFSTKLFALALGAFFTLLLVLLEVPLEGIVTMLVPGFGLLSDLAFDGIEIFLLPFLFALLLLPSLAPKTATQRRP